VTCYPNNPDSAQAVIFHLAVARILVFACESPRGRSPSPLGTVGGGHFLIVK
jgi:hypothetical protein